MQRERFYNLYEDGTVVFEYDTREEANCGAAAGRVALIRVRPK